MITRIIAAALKQLQPSPQGFKEWARFKGLGAVRDSAEPAPLCSASLTLTLRALKRVTPVNRAGR